MGENLPKNLKKWHNGKKTAKWLNNENNNYKCNYNIFK